MINNIRIRNFRCLRDVSVSLQPLTVLVGPNDSGKSAFLDSIRYGLSQLSMDPLDAWRGSHIDTIEVVGATSEGHFSRSGGAGTKWKNQADRVLPLAFFQVPAGGIEMRSAGYRDEGSPPEIGTKGENIPGLLDHFLRRDRKRFFDYVESVCGLIKGLEGIEIGTPDASHRQIDLIIEEGFRFPAEKSSVGVRLLLFFTALAYHPSPPRTILIEEPENGVHPRRLADIVRLLHEITAGKHGGHAAQIVLTTHSPNLLDHVDLSKDQVLVFKRNPDGSRTAEPADAERLKVFLDEFMLGEVWYNEGEEGLVARKP